MIKTKVVIFFKNRVNNIRSIIINSSGLSSIYFDSTIANVIDLSNDEAFKFLNKILERGAEIERLKVHVDIDC